MTVKQMHAVESCCVATYNIWMPDDANLHVKYQEPIWHQTDRRVAVRRSDLVAGDALQHLLRVHIRRFCDVTIWLVHQFPPLMAQVTALVWVCSSAKKLLSVTMR